MVVEVSLQPELVAGDPIARRDPAGHGSGTWTGAAGVPRRGRLRICRSATARLIAQAAPTSSAVGRFPAPKIAAPKPSVRDRATPRAGVVAGVHGGRVAVALGECVCLDHDRCPFGVVGVCDADDDVAALAAGVGEPVGRRDVVQVDGRLAVR